jgi:hypothetical protein
MNAMNPRLNICILGHPSSFFKLMRDDKKEDDGLIKDFYHRAQSHVFLMLM